MMNLRKFKYINIDVLIGEKTSFTGDINSESAVKIDGIVKGNLTTTKEVIVSETGRVYGDVTASGLIVAGKLEGNATIADQLVIKGTGSLLGDIESGSLVIEEGGEFVGKNCKQKAPAPKEDNPTEEVN